MVDYSRYELPISTLDSTFRRGQSGGFTFNPNPSDPELLALRTGALNDARITRKNNVNELARAGMLGSSTAFGVLGSGEQDLASRLEAIKEAIYGKQRREAFGLYEGDLNYRRDIELANLQQMLGLRTNQQGMDYQSSQAMWQALGELGGLGGDLLTGYLSSMWGAPMGAIK